MANLKTVSAPWSMGSYLENEIKSLSLPHDMVISTHNDFESFISIASLEFNDEWVDYMPDEIKRLVCMLDAAYDGGDRTHLQGVGVRKREKTVTVAGSHIGHVILDELAKMADPYACIDDTKPVTFEDTYKITYRVRLPEDFLPLLRELSRNIHDETT